MRFVGCSLAWRPGEAGERPSCLVVLDERGSIVANSFATGAEEISAAVEGYGAERRGLVIGADAPLSVRRAHDMSEFFRFLARRMPQLLEEWDAERRTD